VIVEMISDEGPAYTYSDEDFEKLCDELLGEGMPVSAADVIAYLVSRGDILITADAVIEEAPLPDDLVPTPSADADAPGGDQ
jgi:hypothetical protein